MTMYNCFNCGKNLHISRMGFVNIKLKVNKLLINKEIPLCKRCLAKAKINYFIDDVGYVVLKEKKQ